MLAIKLLGAASGYILAWWVTQHEGAAAYGRFELALTVLTIGALGARLGLDGVMVKWLASARRSQIPAQPDPTRRRGSSGVDDNPCRFCVLCIGFLGIKRIDILVRR